MATQSATPTPGGHCPRRKKIVKAGRSFKVKLDTRDGKGSRVNQVVSLMTLGGVIELIGVWNAEGNDDGYDPFLKNSVREGGTFSQRSGIFRLADRRSPPGGPYDYWPSPQKQRKRDGSPFARHWYMRLVDAEANQDSVEVRRKILNSVCHATELTVAIAWLFPVYRQFLKKSEERDRYKRAEAQRSGEDTNDAFGVPSFATSSTLLRNQYVVPDHWDQTPEERLPLDRYVTDQFVGQAIYTAMELPSPRAYQTFATDYPDDAAYFFSGPPYSMRAVTDFGYQNPYQFVSDEEYRKRNASGDNDKTNDNDGEGKDGNDNGGQLRTADDDYFDFGNCSD